MQAVTKANPVVKIGSEPQHLYGPGHLSAGEDPHLIKAKHTVSSAPFVTLCFACQECLLHDGWICWVSKNADTVNWSQQSISALRLRCFTAICMVHIASAYCYVEIMSGRPHAMPYQLPKEYGATTVQTAFCCIHSMT